MATLEISDETADKLLIDMLREMADTQIAAIMLARGQIIQYPDTAHGRWADVQDCLEVLAAVNRILDYCGEAPVQLVAGIEKMAEEEE